MAIARLSDGDDGKILPEAVAKEVTDASILLFRRLFDTSAPETMLARLTSLGVKVIIAHGFETRFYDKCIAQGLLPVILDEETTNELEGHIGAHSDVTTTIDLERQTIERPGMDPVPFGVDARARNKLLLGLTDVEEALRYLKDVAGLRDEDRKRRPWLYGGER